MESLAIESSSRSGIFLIAHYSAGGKGNYGCTISTSKGKDSAGVGEFGSSKGHGPQTPKAQSMT